MSKEKALKTDDWCMSDFDSNIVKAKSDGAFIAHATKIKIEIDGCGNDEIWTHVDWYGMNYVWMGEPVDEKDYYGKFKLAWDSEHLYILVMIKDDHLNPTLENGTENYWKGDYVEVFIDEDQSGGVHQFNHQAFAYHVTTEGHSVDKNMKKETVFFDDHITVARARKGNNYLWELAIKLFDDQFEEGSLNNTPAVIVPQKRIGFSIAYGDNDGNMSRENFMGSKINHGVNNDEGYVNADVFGSILFVE